MSFRSSSISRSKRASKLHVTAKGLGLVALFGLNCEPPQDASPPVVSVKQAILSDCLGTTLVSAIANANTAGQAAVISLMGGCTYNLDTINNYQMGPNALPMIQTDITIDGGPQGATITRSSSAPDMRIFYVAGMNLPPNMPGKLTLKNVTLTRGVARGGSSGPTQFSGGGGMGAGGAMFVQGQAVLSGVTLYQNAAYGGNSGSATANNGSPFSTGGGGMGGDSVDVGGGGFRNATGVNGGNGVSNTEGGTITAGGTAPGTLNGLPGVGTSGGESAGNGGLGGAGGGPNATAGGYMVDGNGGGGGGVAPNCGGGGGAGFGGSGGMGGMANAISCGGGGGYGGGGALAGGGGVGGGGGGGTNALKNSTGGGGGGFGGGGGGSGVNGGYGGHGGFGGGGGGTGMALARGGFGGGDSVPQGVATNSGGGGLGAGGAIFVFQGGTVSIVNSTLTDNTAAGGTAGVSNNAPNREGGNGGSGLGGAVFILNGTVMVQNSTLAYNAALAGAGAASGEGNGSDIYGLTYRFSDTSVTLQNSILADASAGASNLVMRRQGSKVPTLTLDGANLVMTMNNQGGSVTTGTLTLNADPMLAPLKSGMADPTATMALLPGSPAIGAGVAQNCSAAPVSGVDQRGLPRMTCDIGAWQTQPTLTPDGGTGSDADTGRGTGGGFTCAASGAKNPSGLFSLAALALGIAALLRRKRTPSTWPARTSLVRHCGSSVLTTRLL